MGKYCCQSIGGGNIDRKRLGDHVRKVIAYYILHPEEARLKLQLLCANCNTKKSRSY